MTPTEKSRRIRALGQQLGFDRVGIAAAGRVPRADYYHRWLANGRAGNMEYLHRSVEQRTDPRALLPGARSVIVVASNYNQPAPPRPEDGRPRGRVAMYAWGRDYHRVVGNKLRTMIERMRATFDERFEAKACVDTAPLLERECAAAAGVGWIGKNTLVLDAELGSYFVLGEIVTTLALVPDAPVPDACGTCTRCLDACPTGALRTPYEMDASRCISYLTIELRDDVPVDLKPLMADWVFGCDICQAVCPYNRKAPVTSEPSYAMRPPGPFPVLADLLAWNEEYYRATLRGSAVKRAKLYMLHRNARIALENRSSTDV